jgi:hypothetical protein
LFDKLFQDLLTNDLKLYLLHLSYFLFYNLQGGNIDLFSMIVDVMEEDCEFINLTCEIVIFKSFMKFLYKKELFKKNIKRGKKNKIKKNLKTYKILTYEIWTTNNNFYQYLFV